MGLGRTSFGDRVRRFTPETTTCLRAAVGSTVRLGIAPTPALERRLLGSTGPGRNDRNRGGGCHLQNSLTPPSRRATAHYRVECAREMALVGKTTARCDQGQTLCRAFHLHTGQLDSTQYQPAVRGHASAGLERMCELAPRQTASPCQYFNGAAAVGSGEQKLLGAASLPRG